MLFLTNISWIFSGSVYIMGNDNFARYGLADQAVRQRGEYMPQRTDIHKVLIIGSGPIVIGQACEFERS